MVNIPTRISTTSITPSPSSSLKNASHSFPIHFIIASFSLPLCFHPIDIIAGSRINTITTASIRNIGSSSFVPASSPRRLASPFCCSQASVISCSNSFCMSRVPVRRFCSSSPLSFRYCCSPQRRPNSSMALLSGIPCCIRAKASAISSKAGLIFPCFSARS